MSPIPTSTPDLASPRFKANPQPFYAELRAHAPVCRVRVEVANIATERYALQDVEVAGITIPRGDLVLAVLGSANRDERRFTEPETLDVARVPNPHLAFVRGAHYCLGAPLARLEGPLGPSAPWCADGPSCAWRYRGPRCAGGPGCSCGERNACRWLPRLGPDS